MPGTDRQTAGKGEIFLDHVGWFLPDLEQSLEVFQALGFILTPTSIHGHRDPKTDELIRVGSANRLAMLPLGYLEFLMPVAGTDTPVSRHMRTALGAHTGVHLAAFNVPDAEAEARAVAARGIDVMPTTHLRRDVETEDGGTAEAAFTVIRAELGSLPEGRLQSVTHHTPQHVWQPRHIAGNGISGLTDVLWSSPDPKASAARLSAYTGRPARQSGRGWVIALDRGALTVMPPEEAAAATGLTGLPPDWPTDQPKIAAIGLSGDPNQLASIAASARIPTQERGQALIIPATAAAGAALVVRTPTANEEGVA